jgi:energy-coupling factor transporter transmembrane protein EcfT
MEPDAAKVPEASLRRPTSWPPYREPFASTVARNATLAVVIGGIVAWRAGTIALWPVVSAAALWLTFGGHYLEVWYLSWLRPRLTPSRVVGAAVRVIVWFLGGILLGNGVKATLRLSSLTQGTRRPAWWLFGVILVVAELLVHAMLSLRRRPNFYDGAG